MKRKTDLQNLVIYSIYVRAHGKQGKFCEVEADLERIKALGADIIWFLPIHPIGRLNAKGSLGCPYSISDYRAVNPEYGSLDDFKRLIEKAHRLGLKVLIDVVYHHTSHDSNLINEHPEWYRQNKDGSPQTSVPEWSDIIDLKHPDPLLSQYLRESLAEWARLGVDGFRCDVASLIPLSFWKHAAKELAEINPELIWLAESVNPDFIRDRRQAGLIAHCDAELYEAFDILYDYDIWFMWKACLEGKFPLERYIELLALQDAILPTDFCKLRFVENHDQKRIMAAAASESQALAWTAFQAFNKGAFLIYGGQESKARETPSLFEKEPVHWGNYELSAFFSKLAELKKSEIQKKGKLFILETKPCIQAVWQESSGCHYGVFNINDTKGPLRLQLEDGVYENLLDRSSVQVKNSMINCPDSAMILLQKKAQKFNSYLPEFWAHKD